MGSTLLDLTLELIHESAMSVIHYHIFFTSPLPEIKLLTGIANQYKPNFGDMMLKTTLDLDHHNCSELIIQSAGAK